LTPPPHTVAGPPVRDPASPVSHLPCGAAMPQWACRARPLAQGLCRPRATPLSPGPDPLLLPLCGAPIQDQDAPPFPSLPALQGNLRRHTMSSFPHPPHLKSIAHDSLCTPLRFARARSPKSPRRRRIRSHRRRRQHVLTVSPASERFAAEPPCPSPFPSILGAVGTSNPC
jgi:hypothetical protein